MAFYSIFKPLLFQFDPEQVHDLAIKIMSERPALAAFLPGAKPDKRYQLSDGHMTWSFPIGLAAGFDKNAKAVEFLSRLGFGAIEVGTITPEPQAGNPRPRIKRLPKDESLVNAMGFPNEGQLEIAERLKKLINSNALIGANLGKNKDTSIEKTPNDYAMLYETFAPLSSYLVINISSPNTPGLRALQSKEGFRSICEALQDKRNGLKRPLYLKIAPELDPKDLRDLIELCKEYSLSGIIATNTSLKHNQGAGGLSGRLMREEAKAAREMALEMTKETPDLSVIGAGGIESFQDLLDFWKKGGRLCQIYTSFIYKGPGILKSIQKEIDQALDRSGAKDLQEFVDSLALP